MSRHGKETVSDAGNAGTTHTQGDGSRSRSTDPLYASLASCKVLPTRFVDWDTMACLGLKDDMESLFANMGLQQYMYLREFTHDVETRHFLRSLRPIRERTTEAISGIRFKIHGERYRLQIRDLCDIYGFERFTIGEDDIGTTPGMMDLWHRTASGVYRLGKAKASNIRNPAIKLAQRSLGYAFFGRHVTGPLITDEWKMVCFALRPLITELEPRVRAIPATDPVIEFIAHLLRTQDIARGKRATRWPLCIGGTLTPIFRHCGVELTEPIPMIPLIDMPHLLSSHFLSRSSSGAYVYTYTWDGHRELVLPRPDLVSLHVPGNIVFAHVFDDMEQDSTSSDPDGGQDDDTPVYGDARYIQPIRGVPRTPMEEQLVQQNSLLQRWNKWQSRTMSKMAKSIKALKRHVRSIDRHTGHHCSPSYDEMRTKGRHDREATPESSNPSIDLDTPSASGTESESPTF